MFVKSHEFKEALKEIFEIEKVLETCFSNYNQQRPSTALIKKAEENKFLLTNDAITILNTLGIKNWLIKNYFFEYLNKHSSIYGDNCKVFYFYICEFLRFVVLKNEDEWTKYRLINLSALYESISKKSINHPSVRIVENLDEILDENREMLMNKTDKAKLSVLNDLKIEKNFTTQLNLLIIDIIKNNLKDLNNILDNSKHILYFTKSCSTSNEAKLYKNGFFINRNFQIKNLKNNKNGLFKAIFLDNSLIFALNAESVTIRNSSLNVLANLSLFTNQNVFRENFIKNLQDLKIEIILTVKPLNDWQKSQLNRLNCSVVSYLDEEYVDYLCFKLGINKISSLDDFNEKNILNLNKIELILDKNHEILYFFQLDNLNSSLIFAHIDVFLDSFQQQIKSHYFKVIKTIRLLSQNKKLINCSFFEEIFCLGEFDALDELYEDFFHVFKNLNKKFNKNRINMTIYEPFELKMRCLFGTLELLKQLFSLDDIVYIRSSKSIKIKNYEEEDD